MRPHWESLPSWLQVRVGELLGSPVVAAASQEAGFSPGVAARVRCADGARAFVKAVSSEANPSTPDMHRREARVTAALPAATGAPGLLGVVDEDPWVALVLEEVDGRPPGRPWQDAELTAALALLDRLAVELTPSPVDLEPAAALHAMDGWATLAAVGTALSPWEDRHLDALVALERQWPAASEGTSLLHLDVRGDNMLVRPDGSVVLVDWPSAAVGSPVCDVAFLLPSVVLDGGPAPEQVLARSAVGRAADPGQVDVLVAAFAGYLQHRRRQPPPPGLPTARAFQAAQGDVTLIWLADRLGWERPGC